MSLTAQAISSYAAQLVFSYFPFNFMFFNGFTASGGVQRSSGNGSRPLSAGSKSSRTHPCPGAIDDQR
jgi:hypothetical protein